MAAFVVVVLFFSPLCLCCNAGARPKSRAKVIEDYVLSANFDDNMALPHVRPKGEYEQKTLGNKKRISREDAEPKVLEPPYFRPEPDLIYDKPTGVANYDGGYIKERDLPLAGPHHHHPKPATVSPHAVYIVGFMSFFILLSVLQGSLTMLSKKPGLLGGLLGGGVGKPKDASREFEEPLLGLRLRR